MYSVKMANDNTMVFSKNNTEAKILLKHLVFVMD